MSRWSPRSLVGPRRLQTVVRRRFGVDRRGLATLRVAVGTLLLVDLALRARHLQTFYTDAGVLPRAALRSAYPVLSRLSVHALFGSAVWATALFVLAGVAAVALVAGYRTRLVTVISLALLTSLHVRNPLLLNGGDSVLRRLLLWGALLPLGRRWSVDALRREGATDDGDSGRVCSVASAGLLLQVVVVYVVNGLFKLRSELWTSGVALQYVFSLDHLTVLLGDALATRPVLLGVLEPVWLGLLFGSVGFVAFTGRLRTALVGALAGAHLSMLLTMRIGVFPLVSLAALVPFLPPAVWDRVEAAVDSVDRRPLADAVAAVSTRRSGSGSVATGRPWRQWTVAAVAGAALTFVVAWNAVTLGVVDAPSVTGADASEEYRWDMFASPRRTDGWYVAAGRTTTDRAVDPLHDRPLTYDRPPDLANAYPSHRWMRHLFNLRAPRNAELRPVFAEYLCQRWDRRHASSLEHVTVYFVAEPTRLDGPAPTRRRQLHAASCPRAPDSDGR